MPRKPKTTEEYIAHFWSKVDRGGDPESCWEWRGGMSFDGYGHFWFQNKTWTTHRLVWLFETGSLDAWVLHRCHNRKCVNPNHLYAGTPKENTWDMIRAGRSGNKACSKYVDEALAQKMFEESLVPGVHLSEIARKYGVSISAANWNVNKIRDSLGISRKPGKLSIDDRAEILHLYESGHDYKFLSGKFNVGEWSIWNALKWARDNRQKAA